MGVPEGVGGGGYPPPKKGEKAWVLVADWSRGSIKMARVSVDECVFLPSCPVKKKILGSVLEACASC